MERKEDIGPEKVSFATFLLKMLAAGVGVLGQERSARRDIQ